MGAMFKRPVRKQKYEPSVTLLIPAYNEARHIAAKIRDCLHLEYPVEKLEILVACDGSRDQTPAIAQSFADGIRVRVLNFPKNRGKISTLNDGVRDARGEIVVFSDADCAAVSRFAPLSDDEFRRPASGRRQRPLHGDSAPTRSASANPRIFTGNMRPT